MNHNHKVWNETKGFIETQPLALIIVCLKERIRSIFSFSKGSEFLNLNGCFEPSLHTHCIGYSIIFIAPISNSSITTSV